MKVISKFKDYYDSAAGFGVDETVIYVRNKAEIKIPKIATLSIPSVNYENKFGEYCISSKYTKYFGKPEKYEGSYYLAGYIIGLAGRLYTCLKVSNKNDERKYKYLYSVAEFNEIFEEVKMKWIYYGDKFNPESYFNAPLNQLRRKNIFQSYKVPVFVIRITYNNHPLLILNDELKPLEFYRIVDPYTAFNTISGFISGVLGSKENEIVNIADKDMLVAKGFDKWSFKKRKEDKK